MIKLTKANVDGDISKEEVKNALRTISEDQKHFSDVWQSRFISRLNEETRADLTMIPYALRNLTGYSIVEGGRSWKLSILVGDSSSITVTDDPFMTTKRGRIEESKISKNLTLFNLKNFLNYFSSLDENSALYFKPSGEFVGRITIPDIRNVLSIETENKKDSIGISFGGPHTKYIKYYVDGRNELLDRYTTGWLSVDLKSYAQQFQKGEKVVGNNTLFLDESKDRYKLTEALSDILLEGKGALVFIAKENEATRLLRAISDSQPYKGALIRDVPLRNLVKLLEVDGSLIVSPEGKILYSGAQVVMPKRKLETTKRGTRYSTFEFLTNKGYNTVMVSQQGQGEIRPRPTVVQQTRLLQIDDTSKDIKDGTKIDYSSALSKVSPYFAGDELTFFTSGFIPVKELLNFMKTGRIPTRGEVILEIGCGVGRLVQHFAPLYDKAVGVDISEEMVNISTRNLNYLKNIAIRKVTGDGTLNYPDKSFDLVYSYGTFGFVDNKTLNRYVGEVHRILKPEGSIVFQIPNYKSPIGLFHGTSGPLNLTSKELTIERLKLLISGNLDHPTEKSRLGVPRSKDYIRAMMDDKGFDNVRIERPSLMRIYYLVSGLKRE